MGFHLAVQIHGFFVLTACGVAAFAGKPMVHQLQSNGPYQRCDDGEGDQSCQVFHASLQVLTRLV
jgi:hypothetical protein